MPHKDAEARRAYHARYREEHRDDLNAAARHRRAEQPEVVRTYARAYYARYYSAHRIDLNAERRAYRAAHRDDLNAASRAWYAAHRDEIIAERAARRDEINAARRAFYAAHADDLKAASRAWYAAHPDTRRAYYAANRDKLKAASRAYYAAHPTARDDHRRRTLRWRQERKIAALVAYSPGGSPACRTCGEERRWLLGLATDDPARRKPPWLWNCRWYLALEIAGYPAGISVTCRTCRALGRRGAREEYPQGEVNRYDAPGETVEAGIALVEDFAGHLARVLPAFSTSAPPREAGLTGRIAHLLDRAGGNWLGRTTISAGLWDSVPADKITATLAALAAEGRAESRQVQAGGRPREEWRATKAGRPRPHGDEAAAISRSATFPTLPRLSPPTQPM